MVILGLGTLAIPFTHGPVTLAIIAVVMSFGNGIGSGIMMTLGADVAPSDDRNSFLAIFRLISDLGGSFGPFVPSVIAAVHAGYRHRRARGDRAGWCGGPGALGAALLLLRDAVDGARAPSPPGRAGSRRGLAVRRRYTAVTPAQRTSLTI
jgi:MFS family permease